MSWYRQLEIKGKQILKQQIWAYVSAYTAVFIIAFLLAWSPFLQIGKGFIQQGDGRTQNYPYMIYMGRYLRQILMSGINGKLIVPLFDLNICGGDDVIGFLNGQGATDPILLFSLFIPVKYSEYFYNFIAIFRIYISGISFSYLCFYFKKRKFYSLIGSVIYCFSGYAVFFAIRHPYYINPMILFPLLIVGTDKILKKKYPYTLIFATFYAALCGYYHLYMMTIMIGIYAFVRFFELYKVNRLKNFYFIARNGILSYCLGIGLSAIVFFPGIASFLNAGRSGFSNYNGILYGLSYYRTRLLRLIAPPGSQNDLALAAIVLFALVLLFFSQNRYSLKILLISAFAIYMTGMLTCAIISPPLPGRADVFPESWKI